jgi:hypothetical protein
VLDFKIAPILRSQIEEEFENPYVLVMIAAAFDKICVETMQNANI